jgi:putative transposase/transposase-like zinc-binding protein
MNHNRSKYAGERKTRNDAPLKQILAKTRSHWDQDGVSVHVREAFRKVLQCGTPALGGEVFASENGELIVYHTCKSRACPSCGYWATKRWIPERVSALPRVPYKGITFSMPDVLWRVFSENRALADALPVLAADAIKAFIAAKHGLDVGVIAFLHTFNGRLEFNSHVHTMVTAGGWQAASRTWVPTVYYHRDILMRLWRSAVLELLRSALRSNALATAMTIDDMEAMLNEQERWWSIKIQSIDSIEHFFEYSGRYIRRPVIAQRRIVNIDEQTVEFWAKDKPSGKIVQIRCSLEDFVDRLAQHILKRYRHAVRYFGLFAPRVVHQVCEPIFAAIGHKRRPRPTPLRWAVSRKQMSGHDPLIDPTGQRMNWIRYLKPQVVQ